MKVLRASVPLIILSFCLSGCGEGATGSSEQAMNVVAEAYVKLALAVGRYDDDYIDAYYGPTAWREEVAAEACEPALRLETAPEPPDTLEPNERKYLSFSKSFSYTALNLTQFFLVDALRAGDATGTAIAEGAGAGEIALAGLEDLGRASVLAGGAFAGVKKRCQAPGY